MATDSTFFSRADNVVGLLSIVWVVTDFATSDTFGVGPWIAQKEYPVVFAVIYLTGRLVLLSLPLVVLWVGLVSLRRGGPRRRAITYIALGSILSMASFYFAMSWLSLQRSLLSHVTEHRPAIQIEEVAKHNTLPLEKRAELTVLLAQMQYVNEGVHVKHLRPDGTWQTFVPSADDVAKRQERVAMADSFKGSIVLCIIWAAYAVLGFVIALISGLKWKVIPNGS